MTRDEGLRSGLKLQLDGGGYSEDDARPENGADGPAAAPQVPTVVPEEPVELGWQSPDDTTTAIPPASMVDPDVEVDHVLAVIARIEAKVRKKLDPRILQRLAALEKLVS